jgi:hypothetical protein
MLAVYHGIASIDIFFGNQLLPLTRLLLPTYTYVKCVSILLQLFIYYTASKELGMLHLNK